MEIYNLNGMSKIVLITIAVGIFYCCSSTSNAVEENANLKQIDNTMKVSNLSKTTIEFGFHRNGSIKRIFRFEKDMVRIHITKHGPKKELAIPIDSTSFERLFSSIPEEELIGKKKYYSRAKHPKYMTIKTETSERTIVNAFERHSMAQPDTVGIDKLRLIYEEGYRILNKYQ